MNKKIILLLITVLSLCFSCATDTQTQSYDISFEYKNIVEIDINDKDLTLPDFRRLCELDKKELKNYCSVTFLIRDPRIPRPGPVENFQHRIRGIYAPYDKGAIVEVNMALEYKKIGKMWINDGWEFKVYIPEPGSKDLPSYIFTQKHSEPRYVALNPDIIKKIEKEEQ